MKSESSRQRSFDPELDVEFQKLVSGEERSAPIVSHVLNFATGAAVIAMVTALAYHLVLVRSAFYPFGSGRLRWVLTCFIATVVLIDRVRAHYSNAAAAAPYQLALAAAVGVFILSFSSGGGEIMASFAAMGVVWYMAARLARATMIDAANADAASAGIYERLRGKRTARGSEGRQTPAEGGRRSPRWGKKLRKKSGKFKHPGIAVAYFTACGCVIFALTEPILVRAAFRADQQQRSFRYLAAFVGCGMFLLAATTLASVRAYVHKKGIKVFPAAVPVWLVSAAVVVLGLLGLAKLLPCPRPGEIPSRIVALARAAKPREGRGMPAHEPGMTKPEPGQRSSKAKPETDSATAGRRNGADRQGDKGQTETPSEKGQGDGGRKDGGDQGKRGSQSGEQSAMGRIGRALSEAMGLGDDSVGGAGGKGSSRGQSGGGGGGKSQGQKSQRKRSGMKASTSPAPWLDKLMKFLAILIIIAAVLFLLFRAISVIRKHRGKLKDRLKRVLAALRNMFKRKRRVADGTSVEGVRRYARLSTFTNPFDEAGGLRKLSPEEAARFSYQAVLAFTRELGIPRRSEETALEYAQRMKKSLPQIRLQVQMATRAFTRVEYACKPLEEKDIAEMRKLWTFLERQKAGAIPA